MRIGSVLLMSGCVWLGVHVTASAAEAPSPTVSPASRALREAINRIKAYRTVSARIKQDVNLLGYRFSAEGTYRRSGEDRVRLEVTFTVRGTGEKLFEHSLLEVCDGKTWWRRIKMPSSIEYSKLDLAEAKKAAAKVKADASANELFLLREFGFGGLFPLLEGMETFANLRVLPESTKDTWVLAGELSDRMKTRMRQQFHDQKGKLRIPADVPQLCKAFIDKKSGWPMHIELQSQPNPDRAGEKPYSMALTFSEVVMNKPIDAKTFAFSVPADAAEKVADLTPAIVRRFGDIARREAQQRAREAVDANQAAPTPAPAPAPKSQP